MYNNDEALYCLYIENISSLLGLPSETSNEVHIEVGTLSVGSILILAFRDSGCPVVHVKT
ncbi:hypothetical protein V1478_011285 [Vespula squamosa]|uniref:Uncharacterized protein n=1 Tax=Vespula squamosa TaxID=30214 RepID=A0ABD2AEN9_VESSQ